MNSAVETRYHQRKISMTMADLVDADSTNENDNNVLGKVNVTRLACNRVRRDKVSD